MSDTIKEDMIKASTMVVRALVLAGFKNVDYAEDGQIIFPYKGLEIQFTVKVSRRKDYTG